MKELTYSFIEGLLIVKLEEILKWNIQQFNSNEVMLRFNSQCQSTRPIRLPAGFHVPIMESSHHRCQSSSISDERLPVLVFVFVHLHEIRKCIVRQVIFKIAITGHHRRIDDVARHLEGGGHDCFACSPRWAICFPARRSFSI